MLSAFSRIPPSDLILAAGILALAGWLMLTEFRPRRNRDEDDEEPGPLPA